MCGSPAGDRIIDILLAELGSLRKEWSVLVRCNDRKGRILDEQARLTSLHQVAFTVDLGESRLGGARRKFVSISNFKSEQSLDQPIHVQRTAITSRHRGSIEHGLVYIE